MNADTHDSAFRRYSALLERCTNGAPEEVLQAAYELGRWAWGQGLGVVYLTMLHHEALGALLQRLTTRDEIGRAAKGAALIAAECLSVFEMAMRGFQEANAVLAESNRKLEAANQELDAFSYSVSHDLRAPLRAIDGFSRLLIDQYGEKLDDQGRHYLQRVRAGAQHMSMLIDALLGLSRVGRSTLRSESVDLTQMARDIANDLAARDPERAVAVDIADGMTARGDPRLLGVALQNLLGNAWKFTARRPDARIAFDQATEEGETVYRVKDNGAGFDMAYASRLFAPFQRLHRPSDYEGTGIGLATVQRIISRHGGRVWAQAAPDQGATFSFTLGATS
jgi:light-regulated signal transduction histidine kinase (bacteriophytochrome)